MKRLLKNLFDIFIPSKTNTLNPHNYSVGDQSIINGRVILDRESAKVSFGDRTFFGGGSKIIAAEKVEIGSDILISWGVTIVDHNSHSISFSERKDDVVLWGQGLKKWDHVQIKPVIIQDKCWIGFDAIILKGVTLGEGCIVGAGSVVTKSFPAWSVIAGNPAKLIRNLGDNER